jgi:positive regulator of sigma E activity
MGSFRWHLKNARLKDLSALATLFCFAMAASYAVLQESWSILYVILAVKVGTWWLRFVMSERS